MKTIFNIYIISITEGDAIQKHLMYRYEKSERIISNAVKSA